MCCEINTRLNRLYQLFYNCAFRRWETYDHKGRQVSLEFEEENREATCLRIFDIKWVKSLGLLVFFTLVTSWASTRKEMCLDFFLHLGKNRSTTILFFSFHFILVICRGCTTFNWEYFTDWFHAHLVPSCAVTLISYLYCQLFESFLVTRVSSYSILAKSHRVSSN